MELVFALVFGLVIGSFLNVVILRLPLGKSISTPRSQCPKCKKLIAWYDNLPVLSYILLGGRCRHCNKEISKRYPLVEAFTGVVSVLLYLRFGLGLEWSIFLSFCAALIALALIDMDHRTLPDPITLNGIWIGMVANFILAPESAFAARILRWIGLELTNPRVVALIGSVIGMLVGGGLLWGVAEAYLRLRGVEGMGFGDVKMMAMVGAVLGAPLTLFTIMVGSLLGSIIGVLFIQLAGKTREYELPFGTFLSIGGIVAVLYGDTLIQLYIDRLIRPAL